MQRKQQLLNAVLLIVLVGILLSACETVGRVTDSLCVVSDPIYISNDDILTEQTARQILTHNEVGAELCGW